MIIQKDKVPVEISPGTMINNPTIVPSTRAEGTNSGAAIPQIPSDPYFAFEVDTCDLLVPTEIVLFDSNGGYQLNSNFVMDAKVKIRGLTSNYQALLNDLVGNGSVYDVIKQRVVLCNPGEGEGGCCEVGNIALIQFAHAIEVYYSSKGSKPRLKGTIYPDMGITEQQYQLNINTFGYTDIIDNRTAFVYTQEPGIKIIWGFYQTAELGRQQ